MFNSWNQDSNQYRQPEYSTYLQPQFTSYTPPQNNFCNQPQGNLCNRPKYDSFCKPQPDYFKQDECNSFNNSQGNFYGELNNRDPTSSYHGNGSSYEERFGEISNRQRKKQIYGVRGMTREDFFHRLPPTNSPFGLRMLREMGWRDGQAIGKSKEGYIEPIPVDVRFGRQGLCTKEEKEKLNLHGRPKPIKKATPVKNIEGKHPVSFLAEECMKRHIDMPKYEIVFEYGNIHSKSILVSVTAGGKTFEPPNPSPYKKHAKAAAASIALKELEFLRPPT